MRRVLALGVLGILSCAPGTNSNPVTQLRRALMGSERIEIGSTVLRLQMPRAEMADSLAHYQLVSDSVAGREQITVRTARGELLGEVAVLDGEVQAIRKVYHESKSAGQAAFTDLLLRVLESSRQNALASSCYVSWAQWNQDVEGVRQMMASCGGRLVAISHLDDPEFGVQVTVQEVIERPRATLRDPIPDMPQIQIDSVSVAINEGERIVLARLGDFVLEPTPVDSAGLTTWIIRESDTSPVGAVGFLDRRVETVSRFWQVRDQPQAGEVLVQLMDLFERIRGPISTGCPGDVGRESSERRSRTILLLICSSRVYELALEERVTADRTLERSVTVSEQLVWVPGR